MVGAHYLIDGRCAEYRRPKYGDVLLANQQPLPMQRAVLLAAITLIDNEPITVEDVMMLDNSDVEIIMKDIVKATKF